jgi:hypothetical protein
LRRRPVKPRRRTVRLEQRSVKLRHSQLRSRRRRVRLRLAEGNVDRRRVKSGRRYVQTSRHRDERCRRCVKQDQDDVQFIWRRVKQCFCRGDLGLAAVGQRPRQMKLHSDRVKFFCRAAQCRGSPWHCRNCAGNQRPTCVHQKSYFFDFLPGPADISNMWDYRILSIRKLFYCICRQLTAAALCNY